MPGSPDESLLVDKVAEGEMPPKGALGPEQVAAVRAWVEAGRPYASEPLSPRRAGADWWSLRPIRPVSPPAWRGPSTVPAGRRGRLDQDADRCLYPGRARRPRV